VPALSSLVLRLLSQPINYMRAEHLDVCVLSAQPSVPQHRSVHAGWLVDCRLRGSYVPSESEKQDPSLYSRNVQQLMAKRLGWQSTEYAQEDVKLQ
jgi:hypothetical protein